VHVALFLVLFDVFSHFILKRHLQHPSRPFPDEVLQRFSRSDLLVLTMPSTSTVVYSRMSVIKDMLSFFPLPIPIHNVPTIAGRKNTYREERIHLHEVAAADGKKRSTLRDFQ